MTSILRTTNHTFPAFTLFLYLRRYHANRVLASCRAFLLLAREVSSFTLEKWQGLCLKWKVILPGENQEDVQIHGRTELSERDTKKKKKKDGTWARNAALACSKVHIREHLEGVPRIRGARDGLALR